jgi:transmembrane sensor
MNNAMKLDADILEAAAIWYVDLKSAAADDPLHDAHKQWLEADSRHVLAWRRIQKLQKRFQGLPRDIRPETLEKARRSRREMVKALMLVMTVGGAGTAWQQKSRLISLAADYRTAVGQRRDITLADGSQLHLNTDSALDVRFNTEKRELFLHRGEVMVTTASDNHQRPFIVKSAHGQVQALGTRFSVSSDQRRTRVKVFEHAVSLSAADANDSLSLQAGRQADFTEQQYSAATAIPANADAWVQGLLIVSDWRLADFVDELKRYHKGALSCDEKVADYRISGAFHLNDTRAVLENLSSTLPVKVRYLTRFWARVEAG